jgi:hypothetical protein
MGYIFGADMMDRAILEMTLLDEQKLEPYMQYVHKTLRERQLAFQLGRAAPVIKAYCEFLDYSESKCRNLRNTESYQLQLTAVKFAGLSIALGHELAHHLKGHLPQKPSRTVFDMESEADRFGVGLALKAGVTPLLGIGSFVFFGSVSMDLPGAKDPGRHPHALCRGIVAMLAGIDDAERDPRFQTDRQAVRALRAPLEDLKRRESC